MNLVLNVKILFIQKEIIRMNFQKDQIRQMDSHVFIRHIKQKKLLRLEKCIRIRKYKLNLFNFNLYKQRHSVYWYYLYHAYVCTRISKLLFRLTINFVSSFSCCRSVNYLFYFLDFSCYYLEFLLFFFFDNYNILDNW